MARKITNKILELVDDGVLDARTALLAALCYMSEDDVADMARCNELVGEDEDAEEVEEVEDDAADDDAEQAQGVAQ